MADDNEEVRVVLERPMHVFKQGDVIDDVRPGDLFPTKAPHLYAQVKRAFKADGEWVLQFEAELVELSDVPALELPEIDAEVIRNPEADDPSPASTLSKEVRQVLALYDVWADARDDVNTMQEAAGAGRGQYSKADEARADLNERAAELLDRAAAALRAFGH